MAPQYFFASNPSSFSSAFSSLACVSLGNSPFFITATRIDSVPHSHNTITATFLLYSVTLLLSFTKMIDVSGGFPPSPYPLPARGGGIPVFTVPSACSPQPPAGGGRGWPVGVGR